MSRQTFNFHIWALVFIFGIVIQIKALGCEHQQTFEEALKDADAVFLGKSVEENSVGLTTKGGTNLSYLEVKFEVEKSWKLVDKQFVWVRIASKRNGNCGYQGINLQYLVFANRMNDILYVSSFSRTALMNEAKPDLEKLGKDKIEISGGVFRLYAHQFLIILTIFSLILLSVFLIYTINKRHVSRF